MENQDFYKQNTLPHLTKKSETPLTLPGQIGPYKIDSLLSKGGMSYLYLGIHPEKKIPLVVKVLSPKFMAHPEMVQHFLKEAEIIRMTDHPNIIKLYGQGKWENGLYIAMEFVQGVSLKQFIMQQNLSTKSSLEIILQVAYALLHLHTHGVIHRDLKPENILITESGQVKVIDFGIAQLTQDSHRPSPFPKSQFLGTPGYMSPEQKKDPLNVTFATDIYSLGVITFELIVGKLSYGTIQFSLLSKELRPIIEKALAPYVFERYQDIVDFISDISKFLKLEVANRESSQIQDVKEMLKKLEEGHQKLLPPSRPKWDAFDIGLARLTPVPSLGSYYDFYRFEDQSYLILLGEIGQNQVEHLADIGLLKGMVQSLIYETKNSPEKPFEPVKFITTLNAMLSFGENHHAFTFLLLHLIPLESQFSFISCGFEPLVHLPSESSSPRFLSNQNPLLGNSPHHDFLETTENWNEGDILIAHSFQSDLTEKIHECLPSLMQLSAQKQAEGLVSNLANSGEAPLEEIAHTVVCIHRII